jgi:glucose/arabinose dehydrogenase
MLFLKLKSVFRFSVSASLLALSFSFASLASAQITTEVVMSGLNNPRGIAIGADGGVYVTEAGTGAGNITTGPSVRALNMETEFYGASSSVSRLLGGTQSRILSGLPSLAPTGGGGANRAARHRVRWERRGIRRHWFPRWYPRNEPS